MDTSKQLKDLINNKAKKYNLNPQILLTRFFMERFLERISLSKYKSNFILKGGILISSMVGVDNRMTKDMDLTVKGLPLNELFLKNAISEIINIKLDDGTVFELIDINEIREEFEYSGFRARLNAKLNKTQNIIQLDITAGDSITPREINWKYNLLIENREINIVCYPIETILAEKLESILSKNIVTTRMKDFYDCYVLYNFYSKTINNKTLSDALRRTAKTRNTEYIYDNSKQTISLVENDEQLKFLWHAYSSQFSYANGITYENICNVLKEILMNIQLL